MPVALLALRPAQSHPSEPGAFGVAVRPGRADHDAPLVVRLTEESAALAGRPEPGGASGPSPRGRGLLMELASRPGREVEFWLAIGPAPGAAEERAVGLVSLVRSRSATGIRHSIGWLLIHPAARRQGAGRALVALACRRAVELGEEPVWVECRTDWADAMAFWHALGFEPITSPDKIRRPGVVQGKRSPAGTQESP